MIIERIDLYHISQKLISPFVTSFGKQQQRQSLVLAMHGEGLTGWGECVADGTPGYSYETTKTAWHILTDFLIPAVLDLIFQEPDEVRQQLDFVRGHPLAKATVDQAAWDLSAQREGLSFAEKLAQPYAAGPRRRVKVGVSIGIQPTIDETLNTIQDYRDQGYERIKLKIQPGHDIELAQKVRYAFPELTFMVDANSAYTIEDASIFQAMDNLELLMIEQPLGHEDIYDHSQLKLRIKTPLCLDESIHSADHARYALAIQACDIINIKPARVGGWTEARKLHDLCLEAKIPVWCGGMLETGIGRAGQLALASLPGFTLPGDISATERYYEHDIAKPPFTLNSEDSTITVPTKIGLGVEIDWKRLSEVTIREQTFKSG